MSERHTAGRRAEVEIPPMIEAAAITVGHLDGEGHCEHEPR